MNALHEWAPISRDEVTDLMNSLDVMWWFAGGDAIDAFLGYKSREHSDIDVACLRRDQASMQRQLKGWELWRAHAGELRPWPDGERLEADIHDIWCRPKGSRQWRLQLMVDESEGNDWIYRRDARVRRGLDSLCFTQDGTRYLCVEVQLLYKAPGAAISAKNVADFEACLPRMNDSQRAWLRWSLNMAHPGHDWLRYLDNTPQS